MDAYLFISGFLFCYVAGFLGAVYRKNRAHPLNFAIPVIVSLIGGWGLYLLIFTR